VEPAEGPLENDPAVYQAKQLIELTMNRGTAAFLKPTKIEELLANPDYNPQGKALAEADLARLTELAHQWDEQIANARMHDQIVLQQETMDAIKRGDYTIVDSAHTERMPVSPSDLLKREGTLSVGFCPGPRGSSSSGSRLVVLTKESSPNYAFSRKELGRLKQERMAALRVFISQAPGH